MTDNVTNALLEAINSGIEKSLTAQKTANDRAVQQATTTAEKAVKAALGDALKRLETKADEIQNARSRGPAVIAVLGVVFLILGAYALGWTLGHAGISAAHVVGWR